MATLSKLFFVADLKLYRKFMIVMFSLAVIEIIPKESILLAHLAVQKERPTSAWLRTRDL